MHRILTFILSLILLVTPAYCEALAKEAVATVYGQTIYRDELQQKGKSIESIVTTPLYEHFATQNHLVATEPEIKDFISFMNGSAKTSLRPEELEMMRDIARHFILNYKISKALYAKYGGDVIFQQANPLEPIEANYQFLLEQEKAGAFQILNAQERTKFFAYYTQPRSFVIPPSKVSYDQPWWVKKPKLK